MKTTRIGIIDNGSDGSDIYTLLELEEDDQAKAEELNVTELEYAHQLAAAMRSDSTGPGSSFCNHVDVLPLPYTTDRFVIRAIIRRDA